jgi:hypothetical protein
MSYSLTVCKTNANLRNCKHTDDTAIVIGLAFVLSSNRPFGVRTINEGGRKGYSAGSSMRT